MNIAQLASELQSHISNNQLTLYANSMPDTPDINALLSQFFGSGALQISFSAPYPVVTSVITINGTLNGTLFALTNPQVSALFYIAPNGQAELTLALSLPEGWTFSASFPTANLTGTTLDALLFNQPVLVLESYTSDGSGQYANLQQGLNFSGALRLDSPPLEYVNWLFSAPNNLILSGGMAADGSSLAFQLTAPAASILSFGVITLNLQINAQSPLTVQDGEQSLTAYGIITLTSDFQIGTGSSAQHIRVLTILPPSYQGIFRFFADTDSLTTTTLNALSMLTDGLSLSNMIPNRFTAPTHFRLTELSFAVVPVTNDILNLAIGVALVDLEWTILPHLIVLRELNARFVMSTPLAPSLDALSGVIGATFQIGSSTLMLADMSLPDMVITAQLAPNQAPIDVVAVVSYFVGTIPPANQSLIISTLYIQVGAIDQTFYISGGVTGNWTIDFGVSGVPSITLTTIALMIQRAPSSFVARLQAFVSFVGHIIQVFVEFDTSTVNGVSSTNWTFMGGLAPGDSISLQDLANAFLPPDWRQLPSQIQGINISELAIRFSTSPMTFAFNTRVNWPLTLGSQTFNISAALALQSNKTGNQTVVSGQIEGDFTFNNLTLTVGYNFGPATNTLYFKYQNFQVSYDFTLEQLRISFGDVTVSSILQFLVDLAEPGRRFQLASPWDIINTFNLRNLVLVVDFKKRSIELTYRIGVNYTFINLDSLRVTYTQVYGKSKVLVQLTGSFLEQQYSDANPLSWDVLNDSPPITPGTGLKLIDIQYLGLGQHLALSPVPTSVTNSITQLTSALVPVTDPSINPLAQISSGLQFNSASNWLIGAQFTIMETFRVSAVFNDPQFYGVLIDVNGPKADIFQGLRFEALYRKVNSTISVYEATVTLPLSMRSLFFGEVTVTLPSISVSVYTNANFRVNLGYPPNIYDFSTAFNVQIFPFIGKGGIYFAALTGATSNRVPSISNGSFNPVIEFGLALSLGVGSSLTKGPFKGELSLTLNGILAGVLAWFNPNNTMSGGTMYYWLQGSVALVGTATGSVDFKVVKLDASAVASLSTTLTIEAYRAIIINFAANFNFNASMKVLGYTQNFSLSTTLSTSYTIGSSTTTPWRLGSSTPAPSNARLKRSDPLYATTLLALPEHYEQPTRRVKRSVALDSEPGDGKTTIPLLLFPTFSQAMPSDIARGNGQSIPPGDTPIIAANLMLMIENSINPTAVTSDEVRAVDPAALDKPFNVILRQLFAWMIDALHTGSDQVSILDLYELEDELQAGGSLESSLTYERLREFCANHLVFQITPVTEPTSVPTSITFFPMLPDLTLSNAGANADGLNVNFAAFNVVDEQYYAKVDDYFRHLRARYADGVVSDTPEVSGVSLAGESMAQAIFQNYFLLLSKTVVDAAIRLIRNYPYPVIEAATTSLASIADHFPVGSLPYTLREGDTLDGLAARFFVTPQEIAQVNIGIGYDNLQPGRRIEIPVKVHVGSIVTTNQAADILRAGTRVPIQGVAYSTAEGDSLNSISDAFGITPSALISVNGDATGLFRLGAALQIGTVRYTVRPGNTLESIARYFGVTTADITPQTVVVGQSVVIANVTHVIEDGFTIAYTPAPTDTLYSIVAHYFPQTSSDSDLALYYATLLREWNPSVDFSAPLTPDDVIIIPYTNTFANLVLYYFGMALNDFLSDVTLARSTLLQAANLDNDALLAIHAALAIPPLSYAIQAGDTFVSIAQRFNLTLHELAQSISDTPAIFRSGEPFVTVYIPNVPLLPQAELTQALALSGAFNNAAAMVARAMMHGLRLPDPQDSYFQALRAPQLDEPAVLAAITTKPIYALTGQEFAAPAPTVTDYQIVLTKPSGADYIGFPDGTTTLSFALPPQELAYIGDMRNTLFAPEIMRLVAQSVFAYLPFRSPLAQHTAWQAALPPDAPALNPSDQSLTQLAILPFSSALSALVASAADASLLLQPMTSARTDALQPLDTTPLTDAMWASAFPVTIQQMQFDAGDPSALPHRYLVNGVSDEDRLRLSDLWRYLDANPADGAAIYILYTADQATGETLLRSDNVDRSGSFLLKTNLSTESHSEARGRQKRSLAEVEEPAYAASLDAASSRDFLKLLWECSISRSGGFYLNYVTDAGIGLPGLLFDSNLSATITLLVLLDSQSQGGAQPLRSFNNCLALGENLDPGRNNVFMQAPTYIVGKDGADSLARIAAQAGMSGVTAASIAVANQAVYGLLLVGAQLQVNGQPYQIQPGDTFASIAAANSPVTVTDLANANADAAILVPGARVQFAAGGLEMHNALRPGNVGFELVRPNPVTAQDLRDQTDLTMAQTVSNLFSLLTYAITDNEFFAASNFGLTVSPSYGSTGDDVADMPYDVWNYRQVLSILDFAKSPAAPPISTSPALPADNPYAGVSATSTLALELAFNDLYGNQTTTDEPLSLQTPIRFHDSLISVAQYPNALASYEFLASSNVPQLHAGIIFRAQSYLPPFDQAFSDFNQQVRLDRKRYQEIYYQIAQLYQQPQLTTSLGTLASTERGASLGWVIEQALFKFVSSAYFFLSAAEHLTPLAAIIDGGDTLGAVARAYRLTPGELCAANSDVPLGDCFNTAQDTGATINIPQYFIFQAGNTINSVLEWAAANSFDVTVEQLAANIQTVPLNPGAALTVPAQTVTVAPSAPPLVTTAAAGTTTVTDLATNNPDALLTQGITLRLAGLTQLVDEQHNTLRTVAQGFADQLAAQGDTMPVTPADVATANELVPGLYPAGTTLTARQGVIAAGDTLNSVAARFATTPADLLNLNYAAADARQSTPDLYAAQTPLYIADSATPYALQADDTFARVARTFHLSLPALWDHNPQVAFKANRALSVPAHMELASAPNPLYSAYEISGDETLRQVMSAYGWDTDQLTQVNHDLRGIFRLQPMQVGQRTVTVEPDDTIDTLARKAGWAPEAFVNQIQDMNTILRPGGMLIGGGIVTAAGDTLGSLAAKYNYSVEALANANGAINGLLVAGQTLAYAGVTVIVQADDTLGSLAATFDDVEVEQFAAANPDALLTQGIALVPAPRSAIIDAQVTPAYPSPIFPVNVALTLARDPAYVQPEMLDAPGVAAVTTPLIAQAYASSDETLVLTEFAARFETAFPGVKLATGPASADANPHKSLWAVNFGQSDGIQFQIEKDQPEFYAIQPIYRLPWSKTDVPIRPYATDQGLGTAGAVNFQNIDLDAWARAFLSAVDLFLAPQNVMPLFELTDTQAACQQVISAKQKLAAVLSAQTGYIFAPDQNQERPAAQLEAARQAILNQALVELASVYQTDVVVQYPFTVSSPYAASDTAPRLSGKLFGGQYTTTNAETFDTLAAAFEVSAEYLAEVMQTLQYILNTGATVSYPNQPDYTITSAATTLRDLAAVFGVNVGALVTGLTVQNGQSLFRAGVILNLSRIAFPITATSTLDSLAEQFGVTVLDLLLANANVPNLFAPGSIVAINQQSVTVTSGDTLATLGIKLNMTVDDLITALWSTSTDPTLPASQYTLTTGTILHGVQLTPNYNFTTGKVSLNAGSAPATFLLNVRDAAHQSSVFLDLNYQFNEVEFNIDEQALDGYRDSSWLSFVIPITGDTPNARIGQAQIPLIRYGLPNATMLSNQRAVPENPAVSQQNWSYQVTLTDPELMSQDQLSLRVGFNVASVDQFGENHLAPPDTLAEALAQFTAVAPDLDAALHLLHTPDAAAHQSEIAQAATTFAALAQVIAEAWEALDVTVTAPTEANSEQEIHTYHFAFLSNAVDPFRYAILRLTTDEASSELWPALTDLNLQTTLPVRAGSSATERSYYYDRPITEPIQLDAALGMLQSLSPGSGEGLLDFIHQQNGLSGVRVQRNRSLIAGRVTNEAFILQTPLAVFPNQATPVINLNAPVELQVYGSHVLPQERMKRAMVDHFVELAEVTPPSSTPVHPLRASIIVRYSAAPLTSEIDPANTAFVPLLMFTDLPWSAQSDEQSNSEFVERFVSLIQQTARTVGIPPLSGTYLFDLRLYSSVDPTHTLPVFNQHNLFFRFLNITPAELPAGSVNTDYSQALQVNAGGAVQFSLTDGQLPAGLSLNSQTGLLSGQPTTPGAYTFTVTATASQGIGSRAYVLPIRLTLQPTTLPDGIQGEAYNQQLSVTGNINRVNFALASGSLPPGITLASNGRLSGAPQATGMFDFVVIATQRNSPTYGAQHYQLEIVTDVPPPQGGGQTTRFTVDARQQWQATGVSVPAGQRAAIRYVSGQWSVSPGTGTVGPEGARGYTAKPGYSLPGSPEGMLVAKIGENGTPFPVGQTAQTPTGQAGMIYLTANDDTIPEYGRGFADNSGSIVVEIVLPNG